MENIVKYSTVPVTHKCHSRLPPNDRFSVTAAVRANTASPAGHLSNSFSSLVKVDPPVRLPVEQVIHRCKAT